MTGAIQNAAIDRALRAYLLMNTLSNAAAAQARDQLRDYIDLLFSAGERDLDRLTMCGVSFLRDAKAKTAEPLVHSGFSGL